MAQQDPPEAAAAANAPPTPLPMGDLALSAERRTVLAPKLHALLQEFQQLEALEGPDVEPWYARPLAQEPPDAH